MSFGLKQKLVKVALVVGLVMLPFVAAAGEGGQRSSETVRYPLAMTVDDTVRTAQTYTIPNRTSFSFQNTTDLGGRKLYIQLYSNGGPIGWYTEFNQIESKVLTSTNSGQLTVTPHLWMSAGGSIYLRGNWVMVTQFG